MGKMKKIIIFALIAIAFSVSYVSAALIQNGGYEDNLTGWNASPINAVGVTTYWGGITPVEGEKMASLLATGLDRESSTAYIYQSFNVGAGQKPNVSFSYNLMVEGDGRSNVGFSVFIGKLHNWWTLADVILYASQPPITTGWTSLSWEGPEFENATELELYFSIYVVSENTPEPYFTQGFAFVDAVKVDAVPIPSAFWLLGSGLTGLVAVSRRKTKLIGLRKRFKK